MPIAFTSAALVVFFYTNLCFIQLQVYVFLCCVESTSATWQKWTCPFRLAPHSDWPAVGIVPWPHPAWLVTATVIHPYRPPPTPRTVSYHRLSSKMIPRHDVILLPVSAFRPPFLLQVQRPLQRWLTKTTAHPPVTPSRNAILPWLQIPEISKTYPLQLPQPPLPSRTRNRLTLMWP